MIALTLNVLSQILFTFKNQSKSKIFSLISLICCVKCEQKTWSYHKWFIYLHLEDKVVVALFLLLKYEAMSLSHTAPVKKALSLDIIWYPNDLFSAGTPWTCLLGTDRSEVSACYFSCNILRMDHATISYRIRDKKRWFCYDCNIN